MVRRLDNLPIEADVAPGQKALDGAAREIGQLAMKIDIEPLPGERFVNQKLILHPASLPRLFQ
jgi:hypothetical protein